jgi:hypothetical protein
MLITSDISMTIDVKRPITSGYRVLVLLRTENSVSRYLSIKTTNKLSYAALNAGISLKAVKSRRFHRKHCGLINEIGVRRIMYKFELYRLPGPITVAVRSEA